MDLFEYYLFRSPGHFDEKGYGLFLNEMNRFIDQLELIK